jgi:hypothetical protein
VLMRDNSFTPADTTVATGGTVTWANEGRFGHNAASMFPDKTLDGPRILTGERSSHTFTSPDVYHYECVFHPAMVGTVTVITDGAPAAPAIGRASVGVGSATISWTPPEDSQGSPVIGYRVRVNNGLGAFVRDVEVPDSRATQTRVTGLRRGTAYRFEVAALNAVGQSLFSALSNVVVTPRQPFAPRIDRPANHRLTPGGPAPPIAGAPGHRQVTSIQTPPRPLPLPRGCRQRGGYGPPVGPVEPRDSGMSTPPRGPGRRAGPRTPSVAGALGHGCDTRRRPGSTRVGRWRYEPASGCSSGVRACRRVGRACRGVADGWDRFRPCRTRLGQGRRGLAESDADVHRQRCLATSQGVAAAQGRPR